MANKEQVAILWQGVEAWNAWRREHHDARLDLHGADLFGADLHGADLSGVYLRRVNLTGADLRGAFLREADLREANLRVALLRGANFSGAKLYETMFVDVDLSGCKGIESCVHRGPSVVDHRTLERSGSLPLPFLRGVGLPDPLIDYLPSLLNQPIQLYSCFISYSSRDEDFATRLHADLQARGVRCWFAPEDMKIGAKILDTIDEAIRHRDKVLLVVSEASLASEWVEDEVDKAFEEERERKRLVLLPVRVDGAVMAAQDSWAAKLRRARHIGDFTRWKEHDAYSKALERLLRDLKVEANPAADG